MAKGNTRLELTWIGKENRPRLEPRILLEDPERSDHAPHHVNAKALFDNRVIFAHDLPVPHPAKRPCPKHLLSASAFRINRPNTRAVPLARKGDAHQGRVFYCTHSITEACFS